MITENVMMDAVKAGGNRQELHEEIRKLSMQAGAHVKKEGKENNLLKLIAESDAFNLTLEELNGFMNPIDYVGRSVEQVDAYLKDVIKPILDENKDLLGLSVTLKV